MLWLAATFEIGTTSPQRTSLMPDVSIIQRFHSIGLIYLQY